MGRIFLLIMVTVLQNIRNIRKPYKNCLVMNYAKTVELYNKMSVLGSKKFKTLLSALYIIYADFEIFLEC